MYFFEHCVMIYTIITTFNLETENTWVYRLYIIIEFHEKISTQVSLVVVQKINLGYLYKSSFLELTLSKLAAQSFSKYLCVMKPDANT